ncbi:unnamed protein product [Citrullus colocynthis]|uniref:Uncharacterized protein n=1 Tax=Citrullus colocynthis TaxID=252529 RepID=A0ABP0YB11_9ROSI
MKDDKSSLSVPAFFCLPGSDFQARFPWVSRILILPCVEIDWSRLSPVSLPARFSVVVRFRS